MESHEHGAAPRPSVLQQPAVRALLHRWLVEYNPLYLLSAALVLAGLTMMSRELVRDTSAWGGLGVSGLGELYSLALIAGAAFLVRIGRRRPAAMLGLLVVLYQGDLTLHVETCAFLGVIGKVAAGLWVLMFIAKLRGLAWALQLRLSRSAMLVPVLGAVALAAMPHVLREVDGSTRSVLVCLWLFTMAAAVLWTPRDVDAAVPWDARGRRCVRATWAIWGALAVGHALYWAFSFGFEMSVVPFAIPLLATRFIRRESHVWAAVAVTEAAAFFHCPWSFWLVAAMGAASLCLTALRARMVIPERRAAVRSAPPYRSFSPQNPPEDTVTFRVDPKARARLLIGGVILAYMAAWTAGWPGGELPEHRLWLDALLVAACLVTARRTRRLLLAAPFAPVLLHLVARLGWIPEPHGPFQWGIAATGAGFAALLGALFTSWYVGRRIGEPSSPPEGSPPAPSTAAPGP